MYLRHQYLEHQVGHELALRYKVVDTFCSILLPSNHEASCVFATSVYVIETNAEI